MYVQTRASSRQMTRGKPYRNDVGIATERVTGLRPSRGSFILPPRVLE